MGSDETLDEMKSVAKVKVHETQEASAAAP